MPSELRFRFDLEKFVNALAYFSRAGITDLTTLKAAKLLYFADREHLIRYGRPITGDRYIAMDLGPVPEGAYQLIKRVVQPDEVDDPSRRRALQQLEVHRGVFRQYKYPVLRAVTQPDLDVFSESEIEVLSEIVRDYGRRDARTLVNLSHSHLAYRRADATRTQGSSVELPYEYFFEDSPAPLLHVRQLAEQEQEDRDFAERLQSAGRAALIERRKMATAQ